MSDRKTFEYGGYHFTPIRKFHKKEGDFFAISKRLASDFNLGLCTYQDRQKAPYDYKDFYTVATDKECDIFRCEENGLFMTAVLEYTNSLIAPIIIHFLWNSVGAIILGGVSLAEDYPHLFNMTFDGNQLLSGGIYKIEGSVVVFVLNVLMIIGFIVAKKKKDIA